MPLAFPLRHVPARRAAPARARGYTARVTDPTRITLNADEWQEFLGRLYERGDRLDLRAPGERYARDETVDDYVLSAHAEALRSPEIEGDLWGTLEDIDETAGTEAEAWDKIRAFYLGRGCVLVQITDEGTPEAEAEEWLFAGALARRLGLTAAAGDEG